VSAIFDAYHLPVPAGDPEGTLVAGPLRCRFPDPTPELMAAIVGELRQAGRALSERPVSEIVEALDAAAARLVDPKDPLRREAVRMLPLVTGYSEPMVRLVLDRMAADWRADVLDRMLRVELGDPGVLDGFVPAGPGRSARAYGPKLAFHVFAGNVPGVAVTSLVRSLLVKGPVLGKVAAGEPVLPVLAARAIASVDEALGRAIAVTYWPGGTGAVEAFLLAQADLVVVYGGDAVVHSVRERAPVGTRIVEHGPRFSAGVVTAGVPEGDLPPLAMAAARAVALFDQHGCVSPHAIWVEDRDGTRAERFADAVARAMAELEREVPRGRVRPDEAARIQQERGAAELRGHAGQDVRVLAGPGTSWTVVLSDDHAFRPSCLNRFLRIHRVPTVDAALDALSEAGSHLQSVAVAAPAHQIEALAHRLAAAGATRVTTFDRIPWPPAEWHHDGSGPLSELVRWVDLER
jgi:hypothetical protein